MSSDKTNTETNLQFRSRMLDQPLQLDVSSSTLITTYQSVHMQLVQNAPDDGPMRSETCRANISAD